MTRKGKDTEIISVSLPKDTARQLDEMVASAGYPSRSELVRDAVRAFIKEREGLDTLEGTLDGVLILLYDHKAAWEVSEARHSHMHLFRSFMHTDFANHSCPVHEDACKCCEVLLFSGPAEELRSVYERLRAIRHVEVSELFLA